MIILTPRADTTLFCAFSAFFFYIYHHGYYHLLQYFFDYLSPLTHTSRARMTMI